MLLTSTIILDASIILLLCRLSAKQKKMQTTGITNSFAGETKNLIIILGFYSASFLLRFAADKWILPYVIPDEAYLTCIDEDNHNSLCSPFISCVYTLCLCFIWDFFPIGAILLFHK